MKMWNALDFTAKLWQYSEHLQLQPGGCSWFASETMAPCHKYSQRSSVTPTSSLHSFHKLSSMLVGLPMVEVFISSTSWPLLLLEPSYRALQSHTLGTADQSWEGWSSDYSMLTWSKGKLWARANAAQHIIYKKIVKSVVTRLQVSCTQNLNAVRAVNPPSLAGTVRLYINNV